MGRGLRPERGAIGTRCVFFFFFDALRTVFFFLVVRFLAIESGPVYSG